MKEEELTFHASNFPFHSAPLSDTSGQTSRKCSSQVYLCLPCVPSLIPASQPRWQLQGTPSALSSQLLQGLSEGWWPPTSLTPFLLPLTPSSCPGFLSLLHLKEGRRDTYSCLVFIRVGRHLGTHNPGLEAHFAGTEVFCHLTKLCGIP